MINSFRYFFLFAAVMPLVCSCMMMTDDEVMTDAFGRVSLSVRGYVYQSESRPDDPASFQPVAVSVYGRRDVTFEKQTASSMGETSASGYYEVNLSFVLEGDILIKVSVTNDSGQESYVTGIYSWADSFYDREHGLYFCNMHPLYMDSGM